MSNPTDVNPNVERYAPLGLLVNPFAWTVDSGSAGVDAEVVVESNRLFGPLVAAIASEQGKPIRVDKSTEIPAYYPASAISEVEYRLINDESLNVLHAYTQLYMMRRGRVRATLAALGERLAFQDVDKTIAAYIQHVLSEPDTDLASYHVLGDERLAEFATEFGNDPVRTVLDYFGEMEIERQADLAQVADVRLTSLEPDVDEPDEPDEVDQNLATALGTEGLTLERAGGAESEPVDDKTMVVDYIIEYARVHLSPVVARALRVYKERGLAAMSVEFRVTNAPKKTLGAVIRFARFRYRKVVLIFDGFDAWIGVPQDLRVKIANTLSELRWQYAADAVVVAMLDRDQEPELEETFAAATHVPWDFSPVSELQEPDVQLKSEYVDRWLSAAAIPGRDAITSADPVVARLIDVAEGSIDRFVGMARAAIENAAERAVSALDEAALEAGLAAAQEV